MGLRFSQTHLLKNSLVIEDADELQFVANPIDFVIEGGSFPGDRENAVCPVILVISLVQR